MNLVAMALLTVLIFAEKCFPPGARIAQFEALALCYFSGRGPLRGAAQDSLTTSEVESSTWFESSR